MLFWHRVGWEARGNEKPAGIPAGFVKKLFFSSTNDDWQVHKWEIKHNGCGCAVVEIVLLRVQAGNHTDIGDDGAICQA